MTRDKANALREAAERATPGDWMLSGVRDTHPFSAHKILAGEKQEAIALVFFDKRTGLGFADAKFIALADPPTIIDLLAERERLEREVAQFTLENNDLRTEAKHWGADANKEAARAQSAEAALAALKAEVVEVAKDSAAVSELFDRWKRDSTAGAIGEGAAAGSLLLLQRAVGVSGSRARDLLAKLKPADTPSGVTATDTGDAG